MPTVKEPEVKERSSTILARVTLAEKRKFEKLANSKYTTISELIRQLLHQAADSQGQGA
jgi:phage terminase Nu1 subunit (DNA packaging protein)